MMKIGRKKPCPCGSGKKYKRCCLPKDEMAKREATNLAPDKSRAFFTTQAKGERLRPGATEWPIARAYVPISDVWRATGLGTACIVRRQPNGKLTHACFTINLLEHGIELMAGKADQTLIELNDFFESMRDLVPPYEEGPTELASAYIWGAWALGEREGFGFPPQEEALFLPLVPQPPGTPEDWLRQFVGPGGLVPPELMANIAKTVLPEDLPEGKECALLTRMSFALADASSAVKKLQQSKPNKMGFRFVQVKPLGADSEAIFECGRPIPKPPRSMMPLRRGLQIQGQVRITGGKLLAEAMTLSMAAQLAGLLKDTLGGDIRLSSTSWADPLRSAFPAWVLR